MSVKRSIFYSSISWLRYISFLTILTLTSCSNSLEITDEHRDYQKPEDVVAWLYHDFAWEVVISKSPLDAGRFYGQPKDVLERYLSKELATLILNDQKCTQHYGEPCNVNFLMLWNSQDPTATDLRISKADADNIVRVQYEYPHNGEIVKIDFKVEKFEHGLRITDIIYEGGISLQKILRNPI